MKSEKQFSALLQVLAGEQQVIQRTDQKAFTLLSVLGVFMVFFIVHFPKLSSNMNQKNNVQLALTCLRITLNEHKISALRVITLLVEHTVLLCESLADTPSFKQF